MSSAIVQSQALKAAGVRRFAIGLGEQIDAEVLAAMASRQEDYYRAPDGEDLARIYGEIAYAIPCPAEIYWPYRMPVAGALADRTR